MPVIHSWVPAGEVSISTMCSHLSERPNYPFKFPWTWSKSWRSSSHRSAYCSIYMHRLVLLNDLKQLELWQTHAFCVRFQFQSCMHNYLGLQRLFWVSERTFKIGCMKEYWNIQSYILYLLLPYFSLPCSVFRYLTHSFCLSLYLTHSLVVFLISDWDKRSAYLTTGEPSFETVG